MGIKCMKGGGNLHISAAIHYCTLGAGQCFPRFWQSPTISYKCMSQRALHAYREPWSEVRISRIENQEAGSEDRGYWIENWESRMENWESRIGNREARIEDRESRMGLVKPGRENWREWQTGSEQSGSFNVQILLVASKWFCIFPSKIKCNKLQSIVKRN